jgi:hypothetical protein
MLTLHIEAENYTGLVEAAAKALGASVDRPNVEPAKEPEQVQAELPLPSPEASRGRPGRPRKQNTTATEAAPEGDSSGSQPAVEQNTGSDQAGQLSPPAGGVSGAAGEPEGSPVASISRDDLKAKLNAVKDKFTTNEDTMAGLTQVTQIINAFGYQKVKDIAEEHFGAIVAKCDETLAAA